MATVHLTLDMADPVAVMDYIGTASKGWSADRLSALGADLKQCFADDTVVDVTLGPNGMATAIIHAAFLDVLAKHGLKG